MCVGTPVKLGWRGGANQGKGGERGDWVVTNMGQRGGCGVRMDGWLGFNGISSTKVAAISYLKKFKVC